MAPTLTGATGTGPTVTGATRAGAARAGAGTTARRRPPPPRPAGRRWWRDATGPATWLSGLGGGLLWGRHGGVHALATTPGLLKGTGQLTGLIASDLLLIQVLLMARIPWIERVYGQDELAARHRLVGFASFHLMVVHVVLIVLGYAADDHTGV